MKRAFEVRYFGPTNTRGSRYRVRSSLFARTRWVSYPYELGGDARSVYAVKQAARKEGFTLGDQAEVYHFDDFDIIIAEVTTENDHAK